VTEPTTTVPKHELYEIWDLQDQLRGYQFAAQMPNCVMYFQTREKAESYIASVKTERKKQGLKETAVSR
jgi:hypothetical protein